MASPHFTVDSVASGPWFLVAGAVAPYVSSYNQRLERHSKFPPPAMAFRINVPPITRSLLAVLVFLSTLNALMRWTGLGSYRTDPLPQLTMMPRGSSLRYPWTFFTATFVEQNIVSFLISGATLFYGGKYLERAWSSAEFARFVLFLVMIPNLITYFVYYTWFALRGTSSCVGFVHTTCPTSTRPR